MNLQQPPATPQETLTVLTNRLRYLAALDDVAWLETLSQFAGTRIRNVQAMAADRQEAGDEALIGGDL